MDRVLVPVGYPTSTIYVDESGTPNKGLFVVGALKVRRHGDLMRNVRAIRDKHEMYGELKFSKLSKAKIGVYQELLDCLVQGDTAFVATRVDSATVDLRLMESTQWQQRLVVTTQLLKGAIVKRELVSVVLDHVTTPPGVAFEDEVQWRVNNSFGNKSIITSTMVDSKSSDGAQLADLLCSAIRFDQMRRGSDAGANVWKSAFTDHVLSAFNVRNLGPQRTVRLNIADYRGTPGARTLFD